MESLQIESDGGVQTKMRYKNKIFIRGIAASVSVLLASGCGKSCEPATSQARIEITVPARDGPGGPVEMDSIEGRVVGVNERHVKVLIYAHAGDRWWVEPYASAPFTNVGSDGQWRTTIYLGHEYAALLVHKEYSSPPAQTMSLPPIGGCIWAIDTKPGRT